MTHRTHAILSNALNALGLSVTKACDWFKSLPLETRREALKTNVVRFILDNRSEWNK